MEEQQAQSLMDRDEDEHVPHGQRVADTFQMADFFVRLGGNHDALKEDIRRIVDILFSCPRMTPTFDEYAMHLAFSASLRSADLARQVGAVIAKNREIIATGANDCPRFGGGLYWPEFNTETRSVEDEKGGRDYMRGEDSNSMERQRIVENIVGIGTEHGLSEEDLRRALQASRLMDLTEYGRSVHAEMEALLCCARNNISARGGTLFTTTFPCHNCAKHIVAAGIKRVVYIEPYPKSLALDLHPDSIVFGFDEGDQLKNRVRFEPFVGVGPRRFFDLFSMTLGSGRRVDRKDNCGKAVDWVIEDGHLRLQMLPCSYLDLELVAATMFEDAFKLSTIQDR